MKAILYIGAVLMTGAGIYGFIDYKKSNRSHDLSGIYETRETGATVQDLKAAKQKEQLNKNEKGKAPEIKTLVPIKRTLPVTAPKTDAEPPKISPPENIPVTIEEPETALTPEAGIKDNENRKKITTGKKRKKVNHKMFSRAPLDEKYLEKEMLKEEPSKETKTEGKKEQ